MIVTALSILVAANLSGVLESRLDITPATLPTLAVAGVVLMPALLMGFEFFEPSRTHSPAHSHAE